MGPFIEGLKNFCGAVFIIGSAMLAVNLVAAIVVILCYGVLDR